MNSLVSYVVSSDSDSDGDLKVSHHVETDKSENIHASATRAKNFLLEGSGSSSSNSESEFEDKVDEPDEQDHSASFKTELCLTPTQLQHSDLVVATSSNNKLPPPSLDATGGLLGSSVFTNPFKEQADERLNILQKHVSLTLQAKPALIAGKKICISYRKDGRCRFGSRCKYAHDSDLQNTATFVDRTDSDEVFNPCSDQSQPSHSALLQTPNCPATMPSSEDGGMEEGRPNKKRAGLAETLIPPKRALKQFERQRQKENHSYF